MIETEKINKLRDIIVDELMEKGFDERDTNALPKSFILSRSSKPFSINSSTIISLNLFIFSVDLSMIETEKINKLRDIIVDELMEKGFDERDNINDN
jgi:hypothetical protein